MIREVMAKLWRWYGEEKIEEGLCQVQPHTGSYKETTLCWHIPNETGPTLYTIKLEMWANAQRDGRPAEYRWHHLFNAAKFG